MTDLTPKAEALREKLTQTLMQIDDETHWDYDVRRVIRTIVEELGITEKMIEHLVISGHDGSALALSTLLELAGVKA